jgi:hypothetical protein
MTVRLNRYPAAQSLARDVVEFYGDFFEFREDPSYSGGWTTVGLSPGPRFDQLSIELQVDTGEEAETLGHELLHASLPMRGLPIPYLSDDAAIPAALRGRLGAIFGMIRTQLHSYVQHEITIEEFVRMGFDIQKFIRVPDPGGFEAVARQHIEALSSPVVALGAFPYWCLEYFLMWIATRQGQRTQEWAEDAFKAASLVFPEFPAAAERIEEWINAGRYKDFDQFPAEMTRLCELMRLPPTTDWIVLVKGAEPGRPVPVYWPLR